MLLARPSLCDDCQADKRANISVVIYYDVVCVATEKNDETIEGRAIYSQRGYFTAIFKVFIQSFLNEFVPFTSTCLPCNFFL